jgi:hypothetical protein
MANPFATSELLKSASRYPVSKDRHGHEEQVASALAGRANSLRTSFNNDLKGAAQAHREIGTAHLILANKLSGYAAEANQAAADAHTAAAEKIEAIMPPSGGSFAAASLTGDNAVAFSVNAAKMSDNALQAIINHFDDSMQEVGIDHPWEREPFEDGSDEDNSDPDEDDGGDESVDSDGGDDGGDEGDVSKSADPVETFGNDARKLADKHGGLNPDYRGIGGAHLGMGIRHHDLAERLAAKAQMLRSENLGSPTPESRLYDDASTAHRDAMQAHYTAGRTNDDAAFTTSKVEGATPSTRRNRGNTKYSSKVAADASQKADDLTKQALDYGKDSIDA